MEERRQQIAELITQEGQITFSALRAHFPEVSEMTLRTDLKWLDEAGKIIRIHGGARSIETVANTDGHLSKRSVRNTEQKRQIARKAVELLHSHSSVFIDSGSTVTELSRLVPDEERIIYTSGLSCALELCGLTRPTVYLPGGQLNRYSMSVAGGQTIRELESCHFDICFLGTASFSPKFGFCTESKDDALLKSVAISRSDMTVVLMDSGKFGMANAHSFAAARQIDILVSDSQLTKEQREYFTGEGVMVL